MTAPSRFKEDVDAPDDLAARLREAEEALTKVAQEAYERGYVVWINTHDGIIAYHDPKYTATNPKLRFATIDQEKARWKRR